MEGKDQTVPDVMSRWAYPVAHAAPDVSIMGSQAVVEDGKQTTGRNRNWLILRWSATFLQSSSGHTVPGTDSLPVCVRPENRCICRRSSQISLRFAGFMRKNTVPGTFIRVTCGIGNTGFLFPQARTAVPKGSSGPCAKIMICRTGLIRSGPCVCLYFRFTVGILRALDGVFAL